MKKSSIIFVAIIILAFGGGLIYAITKSKIAAQSGTPISSQSSLKADTSDVLDYRNKGLSSIGPDVYNQSAVSTLLLSNNTIKTLPSQMGRMINLQVLKLDHNQLNGSLVGEVRLMPLTTLDVSYNNMTGMPAEIGQLNKLVILNYSYNKITGLPDELAKLKNNLKTFDLTGNPLSQSKINKLKSELPNTNIIF